MIPAHITNAAQVISDWQRSRIFDAMNAVGASSAKPVFDHRGQLYVGNGVDFLSRSPSITNPKGTVDRPQLIFIDPPFNIGQQYNDHVDKMPAERFELMIRGFVYFAAQNAGPQTTIAVHVPAEMVWLILDEARRCDLAAINHVIRVENFGQYRSTGYIRGHQHLLLFSVRDGKPIWNPEPVLVPSVRLEMGDKRTATAQWKGFRPPTTVWEFPRIQGNNAERWSIDRGAMVEHPNQLPIGYLDRIIKAHTLPGGLVIDPCVGSGTTWLASRANGRLFIGCDMGLRTCQSAFRRVHNEIQIAIAECIATDVKYPPTVPTVSDGSSSV